MERAAGDLRLWLGTCLLVGLLLRMAVAVAFPTTYHPDETFQYWEQAYRLAFGEGITPWEYRVGIRSWVLPGMMAAIMAGVEALGGNGLVWRALVQLLLAAASLSIIATAFLWARRLAGPAAAVLAAFIASTWFEFVYFSSRPLTEVVAASALFPAAYLLCARANPAPGRQLAGGLLLGVAVVLRFHIVPAALVILAASVISSGWRGSQLQLIAAAMVVLAGGLIDWITWGSPFQSIWMNFAINVLEDRASSFGQRPPFWYVFYYANAWAGFLVPMVLFIGLGTRRSPLLLLVALSILLTHSAIAHKEYRFLYPTLPFLLTLASVGAADAFAALTKAMTVRRRRALFLLFGGGWLITSVTLAAQDGFSPNFVKHQGLLQAFERVREKPQLCGLAIVGKQHWTGSPGYAGLQRNVPMFLLDPTDTAALSSESFNALVFPQSWSGGAPDGYGDRYCAWGFCTAVRTGACSPPGLETVNETLARQGW